MKIAICDDEEMFSSQLKEYLESYYKSMDLIIDKFESGEEFLKRYTNMNCGYDIIFLDIEMKQIDGIETAKKLRELNNDIIIIFLTSHLEFAPEGYEVNAFRFLIKPIQKEKLKNALLDVQYQIDRNKKILIKDKDREVLLKYTDIVYIEAQNVNIKICTMNEKFLIRKTLREIEEELKGPTFFKCHRSYIVNLDFVIDYDNKIITMENKEKISLSRNKYSDFKNYMITYLRSIGR